MPFQPGQSGNPGGRPRKSDDDRKVEKLARSYGAEALRTLASIMRSKKAPASARSAAAQAILDRGFGRPVHAVKHGGDENAEPINLNFKNLSEAQLEALIERLSKG
jgi:hypothetical protein